jgi:RNA polymerase sigma-70 factor (ECF subfamily)
MQSVNHEIWLWNEIRYNNERALYQLYMHSYDHLFGYGIRSIQDTARVMECINEVFIEVWTKRDRLPAVEKVQGYLFIMFKRKLSRTINQKQLVFSIPDEDFIALSHNDCSYEDLLIAYQTEEETKNRVRQAVDKLSPRQKELIRLRYYEGLSLEEISEKLNISLRTIYNTIHSAITLLRKELHG